MSIEKFKQIVNEGLSYSNRYRIMISFDSDVMQLSFDDDLLLCHDVTLPSFNVMSSTIIRDHAHIEMPYGVSYEPVRMTFYIDKGNDIKLKFTKWLTSITAYNEAGRTIGTGFKHEYSASITITILDRKDNEVRNIFLARAFPKSISGLSLNASNDQVSEFTVEFVYDYALELDGKGGRGAEVMSDIVVHEPVEDKPISIAPDKLPENQPIVWQNINYSAIQNTTFDGLSSNSHFNVGLFNSYGNPVVVGTDSQPPGTTTRTPVTFDQGLVSNQFTIGDGIPNQINDGSFSHENDWEIATYSTTVEELVKKRNSAFNKP